MLCVECNLSEVTCEAPDGSPLCEACFRKGMQEALDELEAKGLVYKDEQGRYFNQRQD